MAAAFWLIGGDELIDESRAVLEQEVDAAEVPFLTVSYHNYVEAVSPRVQNYTTSPLAQYDLRTLTISG